jgi:spermidine synthase
MHGAKRGTSLIVLLTLFSGAIALVDEMAWTRALRLVFGATTTSAASVLAIFMGGLGLGAFLLGKRAEKSERPLLLYAVLELGICILAALSPFFIRGVEHIYHGLGGSLGLGFLLADLVRVTLAALAIGLPAVLMGGTLPALSRAVTGRADERRRNVALVYGVNTLGAVFGVLCFSFFLADAVGTRASIWLASLAGAMVATLAWAMDQQGIGRTDVGNAEHEAPKEKEVEVEKKEENSPADVTNAADVDERRDHARLLVASAAVVGFAFFSLELVWFRLAIPIVGGTTYSLGLVLAMALFGIGAGGALYALAPPKKPALSHFAILIGLEGALALFAFALGDGLAHGVNRLMLLPGHSFLRDLGAWSLFCSVVVVPPAVVAGYQFPLLVGLLGRADQEVGRQVGLLYAANTLGSIVGSLLTGFFLLPLVGAEWLWIGVALFLWAWGLAMALKSGGTAARWGLAALGLCIGIAALAPGPTVFWRSSGIGVRRATLAYEDPNLRREGISEKKRWAMENHEGREAFLTFRNRNGLSLITNGKSDGNTIGDAPTTALLSLIPAILHPAPRRAMLVGLGNGLSSGWMAEVPGIEEVITAELEPAVARFAALSKKANYDVMNHPKARLFIADGREMLMASEDQYDLVISEPSNPYRAGMSALFTEEFYASIKARLNTGGIFGQWIQGYEVDRQSIELVVATLKRHFGHVSVWRLRIGDYLLVAQAEARPVNVQEVQARMAKHPYDKAFAYFAGVYDAEGLLALHLAGDPWSQQAAKKWAGVRNDDDLTTVEKMFARTVGRTSLWVTDDAFVIDAIRLNATLPPLDGPVDAGRIADLRRRPYLREGKEVPPTILSSKWGPDDEVFKGIFTRDLAQAGRYARVFKPHPRDLLGWMAVGEALCQAPVLTDDEGRRRIRQAAMRLTHAGLVAQAEWVRACHDLARRDPQGLLKNAMKAIQTMRDNPWVRQPFVRDLLQRLNRVISAPEQKSQVAKALAEAPFALHVLNDVRIKSAIELAHAAEDHATCAAIFKTLEPHPYWQRPWLERRLQCYEAVADPLTHRAQSDLRHFDLLSEKGARTR